jgi:hypothetical protein
MPFDVPIVPRCAVLYVLASGVKANVQGLDGPDKLGQLVRLPECLVSHACWQP